MVVIGKKKYQSGEGTQFLTRKAALKKLQLSLNDFRKLCIIKGIYPREPRNRKRAQKGKAGIRTLYHIKDIQFLMHESIIWKLRENKVFNKKMSRAKGMKNYALMKKYLENKDTLKLDHIVKERYPTFIDALRDLDDCLTLCFLFSSFPSMPHIPRDQSDLCKRLTVEFLNAVIVGKWLRKVFVSIKGYYYQAEIKGQTVTWIVPHNLAFEPQSKQDVDFRIMSTFIEFYIFMLGFVNFRLFHSLNLHYPPKCISHGNGDENYVAERISALNAPLVSLDPTTQAAEDDVTLDTFSTETDEDKLEETRIEAEKLKTLKTLFEGKKFFLNREVPLEPLVFVIRSFGGEVSWNKSSFIGATFSEEDETINYQVVDKPSMEKQFMSRYYVQPQWVFDCVNRCELLPVQEYLMGVILPPHLSPFKNEELNDVYIPPEERALMDPSYKLNDNDDEESEDEEEDNEEMNENENVENDEDDNEEEEEEEEEDDKSGDEKDEAPLDKEKLRLAKKKAMKVKSGQVVKEVPWAQAKEDKHTFNLHSKLMKPRHRKLYKGITEGRKERKMDIHVLRKKRERNDAEKKAQFKEEKKAKKMKLHN